MVSPAFLSQKTSELSLSGPALIELLKAVLEKGRPFRFQAKGFSMFPFIKDEDVITLVTLPAGSLGLGQIVAFISPKSGKLAVHRIIGRKNGCYLIKGDNGWEADGLIPRANILGQVSKIERNSRKMFLGLGVERFLVVLLTRKRSFYESVLPIWKLIRPLVRGKRDAL